MGASICFNFSTERLMQKICRKTALITQTKESFNKKSDKFTTNAISYNKKKANILVGIIKRELSNTENNIERRYLYLCLLDKLVIKNSLFLKLSFQNELVSYVILLSESINKNEQYKYFEEDDTLLISNLAFSCLNKWYEKYSNLEDESIRQIKEYKFNYINTVSNYSLENEDSQNNIIANSPRNICESDHSIPDNIDQINVGIKSEKNSSETNLNAHTALFDFKSIEIQVDQPTVNKEVVIPCKTVLCSIDGTSNMKKSTDYNDELTNDSQDRIEIENEQEVVVPNNDELHCKTDLIKKISKLTDEIETIKDQYNALKEKYLLLIQKNDYLESRLEYYEDFNMYSNTKLQSEKKEKTRFDLFKKIPELPNINKSFVSNFKQLISGNDWVLFENNLIQIGVKSHYSGNMGEISIYIGNKLPTRLEDFVTKINHWNICPKTLLITRNDKNLPPDYIAGKQQICLNYSIECRDIFFGIPTIQINFLLTDNFPKTIELPLPIVLCKFSFRIELEVESIIDLWHSDIFLLSQASLQLEFKSRPNSVSEIIDKCKLGESFSLIIGDEETREKRIYLIGNILSHYVIIQINEATQTCYNIRVRSDSGILSNSILSIIMFQVKDDVFLT
ncbi:adaptin c-terminal domain-containing protein [Cryptosporidium felis]|nr:adaptin c-terminal domain-containing protein [Cryptosporidium felis]